MIMSKINQSEKEKAYDLYTNMVAENAQLTKEEFMEMPDKFINIFRPGSVEPEEELRQCYALFDTPKKETEYAVGVKNGILFAMSAFMINLPGEIHLPIIKK